MINVKINGELKEITPQTISDYIKASRLDKRRIVIEHNKEIVVKEKWHETFLHDDDQLEIITFVSGG